MSSLGCVATAINISRRPLPSRPFFCTTSDLCVHILVLHTRVYIPLEVAIMSAIAPIGLPHPSTIEVATDDPVARANMAIEEKHPDLMEKPQIRERVWGLAARGDSDVTFQEYQHWAVIEREIEREENRRYKEIRGPLTAKSMITDRFSSGHAEKKQNQRRASVEAVAGVDQTAIAGISASSSDDDIMRVTDAEWRQAARALRTAGWGTIFYLVTTDILGWSSAP